MTREKRYNTYDSTKWNHILDGLCTERFTTSSSSSFVLRANRNLLFFGFTLLRQFRSGKFHCFAYRKCWRLRLLHIHTYVWVCVWLAVRTQTISFGPHESKQKSRKKSTNAIFTRAPTHAHKNAFKFRNCTTLTVAFVVGGGSIDTRNISFGSNFVREENWTNEEWDTIDMRDEWDDHRPTERCEAYK